MSLTQVKNAQQSVHLTLGILRTSQAVSYAVAFFWLDGFAVPAPAQVTQTVGQFNEKHNEIEQRFSMMKDQSKFVSATQVFLALTFLFQVFLHFQSALRYDGPENNYLADNWGTLLVFLLPIIFGLGWQVGSFIEYLSLTKGRKITALALAGLILIFVSIEFGSLAFFPFSFTGYAMMASGSILVSGFFLRFSMVSREIIAKQQKRD